jgi:hypothetical protein
MPLFSKGRAGRLTMAPRIREKLLEQLWIQDDDESDEE